MASTLRTPSAWAPSSIDSSPMTVQSRVVRCGIVSMPASRSIVAETMSELIPARAVALSLMSTKPTRPDSGERRADLDDAALESAERRVELDRDHELALSKRSREPRLARLLAQRHGELALLEVERATAACGRPSTAELIAAISVGVVPQQPPMMRAPSSRACAANSAKYSGEACG